MYVSFYVGDSEIQLEVEAAERKIGKTAQENRRFAGADGSVCGDTFLDIV